MRTLPGAQSLLLSLRAVGIRAALDVVGGIRVTSAVRGENPNRSARVATSSGVRCAPLRIRGLACVLSDRRRTIFAAGGRNVSRETSPRSGHRLRRGVADRLFGQACVHRAECQAGGFE